MKLAKNIKFYLRAVLNPSAEHSPKTVEGLVLYILCNRETKGRCSVSAVNLLPPISLSFGHMFSYTLPFV